MTPGELLDLYRHELLEGVVPFWTTHGIDHEQGGYRTLLDRTGRPYGDEKYLWMQGRAVWMYARLHSELDASQGWLRLAEQGARFLRQYARDPATGRVYFSVTRDGRPVHLQRKIYSEVFYVMAMSEMAWATGGEEYLAEARDVFWLIYDLWKHPEKLGRPILPGTPRGSTLADAVVFLGMIEDLAVLEHDPRYDDVVQEVLDMAFRHIKFDRRVVLENVGPDGEAEDSPRGRLTCPGHAIELSWQLIHLAQRTGDDDLITVALQILNWAFDTGWDTEHGGLTYFVDADGRPPVQLEATMKLWWPMAEALYATLVAWKVSGDDYYLQKHREVRDWSWQHLRDAECGEWFGYLDRAGQPTHLLKGGPWKGFFHLPRALLYSIELLAERVAVTDPQLGE